jgi:predicted PurR-regulated permease PerM
MQNRPAPSLPILLLSIAAIIIMLPIALAFMLVMFVYLLITKKKLKKEFGKYFNKNNQTDTSYTGGRTIDQDEIK